MVDALSFAVALAWAIGATLALPLLYSRGISWGEERQRGVQIVAALGHQRELPVSAPSNGLIHADCGGLWGKWETKEIPATYTSSEWKSVPRLERLAYHLGKVGEEVQERTCDQCGYVERREIA